MWRVLFCRIPPPGLAQARPLGQSSHMDWVKIIHILCVMGWMTSIFAVPRALIYWHGLVVRAVCAQRESAARSRSYS